MTMTHKLLISFSVACVACSSPLAANPCYFNKIDLSPDGRSALIWREAPVPLNQSTQSRSSRDFVFATNDGEIKTRRARFPVVSLQWLDNTSEFIAFSSSGRIYGIDPAARTERTIGARSGALSSIHLRAQSYMSEQSLAALQNLNTPSKDELKGRTKKNPVFALKSNIFWIEEVGSESTIFEETAAIQIGENGAFGDLLAYQFSGLGEFNGSFQILGYGMFDRNSHHPFSKPLFDLKTGQYIGIVSPLSISWRKSPDKVSTIHSNGESIFLSASFNGRELAVLESDNLGNQRIRFVDEDGPDKVFDSCSISDGSAEEFPGGAYRFEVGLTSSDAGARLGILTLRGSRHKNTAVIRFTGGPLGDPLEELWSSLTRTISSRGADQLFVTYPGSLGVDSKNAMAFQDFNEKKFTKSLSYLSSWIRDQGYEQIYVVGTSFGALPAYHLSKNLGPKLKAVHLIVPLLYFSESGSALGYANPLSRMTQDQYERSLFGYLENRRAISNFYRHTFDKNCLSKPTFIYFADGDNHIDEDAIPQCLMESERYIYKNASHSSVIELQEFLNDLQIPS